MKLIRTPVIDAAIEKLEVNDRRKYLKNNCYGDNWIDHRAAISLGRLLQIPLCDLFRGTSVFHRHSDSTHEAPRPKTAEYVRLMEQLRRQQQEQQYQEMLRASDKRSNQEAASLRISKETNEQLTTILNVLVSIGAVGWAFWYWCERLSLPVRTLVSMLAAVVTGVAEVVVLSGYWRRVAAAREKERRQPEVQRVIKQIVFEHGQEKVVAIESPGLTGNGQGGDSTLAEKTSFSKQSPGPTTARGPEAHHDGGTSGVTSFVSNVELLDTGVQRRGRSRLSD